MPGDVEVTMSTDDDNLDSNTYEIESVPGKRLSGWIKVGAFAAASALAGGLAAAWFYRRTLSRLHQADQNPYDSEFGIKNEGTEGED